MAIPTLFITAMAHMDAVRGVRAYRIEHDGRLTELAGSPFASKEQNYLHFIAADANGRFVYVANQKEASEGRKRDYILAFAIQADGSLAEVPGSPFPTNDFPGPQTVSLAASMRCRTRSDF